MIILFMYTWFYSAVIESFATQIHNHIFLSILFTLTQHYPNNEINIFDRANPR